MPIGLKLLNKDSQIAEAILWQLVNKINARALGVANRVETFARNLVNDRLMGCPEVRALLDVNSDFHKQMGVDADNVSQLITLFVHSIEVNVNKLRVVSKGTISRKPLFTIKSTFVDKLEESSYAKTVTNAGESLPWLWWLCVAGDSCVIDAWHYTEPNAYERHFFSREGGFMKRGGKWFVPPEYAGSETNNFFTRSLAGIEDEIGQFIMQNMS